MHTSIHWTYPSGILALQAELRLLLLSASHAPHALHTWRRQVIASQGWYSQAELSTGCAQDRLCMHGRGVLQVVRPRPDDRHHPPQLLCSAQAGGSRPCGLPPHVQHVSPLSHQAPRLSQGLLCPLEARPITETVGSHIQDAHDPAALLPGPVPQAAAKGDDAAQVRAADLGVPCRHMRVTVATVLSTTGLGN